MLFINLMAEFPAGPLPLQSRQDICNTPSQCAAVDTQVKTWQQRATLECNTQQAALKWHPSEDLTTTSRISPAVQTCNYKSPGRAFYCRWHPSEDLTTTRGEKGKLSGMELKNKWKRVWMRMKSRRGKGTKLDTTALMKREFHSSSATQESESDDGCKKITFYTDQVSEKQIDRSVYVRIVWCWLMFKF